MLCFKAKVHQKILNFLKDILSLSFDHQQKTFFSYKGIANILKKRKINFICSSWFFGSKVLLHITNLSNQNFQNLKDLLIPLSDSQCVLYKHELLICGGFKQRDCYSYHTLKDEYKTLCSDDNNSNNKDSDEITLLSFGGSKYSKKHTLVMNYISVWNKNSRSNTFKKRKQCYHSAERKEKKESLIENIGLMKKCIRPQAQSILMSVMNTINKFIIITYKNNTHHYMHIYLNRISRWKEIIGQLDPEIKAFFYFFPKFGESKKKLIIVFNKKVFKIVNNHFS
ncbi:hypothetical protein RFI_34269 [Reticulomyxa filosa]|uniref:Uncharacterized protein n=1 Tax=Reticulomyxa filosa TaxID=46433 RepID=X6LP24_RETFI|nr:hypothetical protein RFI_34269 [Reticulomyxa filosa]|eukprot:ETO03141.1 hypothetical protein RFI_34269 [Reticulomyxa filosa]